MQWVMKDLVIGMTAYMQCSFYRDSCARRAPIGLYAVVLCKVYYINHCIDAVPLGPS